MCGNRLFRQAYGWSEQRVFGDDGVLASTVRRLCEKNRLHEALQATELRNQRKMPISRHILYCLLQECMRKKEPTASCRLHSLIVTCGLDSVGFFGDNLIRLYASCGSVLNAYQVFCKIASPSLYTWNAVITAHVELESNQKALELYHKMQQERINPDKFTFLPILKGCGRIGARGHGSLIHGQLIRNRLESDVLIGSTLVHMYTQCGCLKDARKVFDKLGNRDVVSWNAMITGYAQHGSGLPAFELFQIMLQKGPKPNRVTFSCVLKACGNAGAIKEGKLINHQVIINGLDSDVLVANAIVDMYSKCGYLQDAHEVFDEIKQQDVVSWNTIIAGYVLQDRSLAAFEIFGKMQRNGAQPDKVTFSCILQACGTIESIEHGKLIHNEILRNGLEADVVVGRMLVDMYAKCGSLNEGCKVFSNLQGCNVVSWNAMIAGYAQHGNDTASLALFEKLQEHGLQPDNITFSFTLKACGNLGALGKGKLIHKEIAKCGLDLDMIIGSTLIDMYAKCGSLDDGWEVFQKMSNRDVVVWNTMIAGYVRAKQGLSALRLFQEMQHEDVKPDSFTFSCILKACSNAGAIKSSRLIHEEMIKNQCESDVVIGNTLIDMYSKFGKLEESQEIFYALPSWDVVSWNVMIGGYVQHGRGLFALKLFERMQQECVKPDNVTYSYILEACGSAGAKGQGRLIHDQIIKSAGELDAVNGSALVEMYTRCDSLEEGCKVFNALQTRNLFSWKAMIAASAQHRDGLSTLNLFGKMQLEGIKAEKVTFLCALQACGSIGTVLLGRLIHDGIIRSGLDLDLIVGSTVIDMYSKCGILEEARNMFDRIPNYDVVSWNAMIAGYAQHSSCALVGQCLEDMIRHGFTPDDRTFSSILAGCSRAGKVEEGYRYFKSMTEDHGITPNIEHFTCMIDLLSRAGCLNDARGLLQTMPVLPDVVGWRALLSACRTYNDTSLGKCCFTRAIQLDPDNAAGYMLMSNIYADTDMWDSAHEIQQQRMCTGAWKKPGRAWVEINGTVHGFIVADKIHPERDKVYAKLKSLSRILEEKGHTPQIGSVVA